MDLEDEPKEGKLSTTETQLNQLRDEST